MKGNVCRATLTTMPKSRIFLWLMVFFIVGVGMRSFFPVSIISVWAGVVLSVIIIIIGILRKKTKVTVSGFCLILLFCGVLRYAAHDVRIPDMSPFFEKRMVFSGVVDTEPGKSERAQRLNVMVSSADGHALAQPIHTLITTWKYPEYRLGDEILVSGSLREPENFDEFDYVSYLARQGITTVMVFPEIEKTGEHQGYAFYIFLSRAKHVFEGRIARILPEPHASLLNGLLLGERASMSQEFIEDLKRTGTTHIVALSGYNITIVGRFFITLLLFLTIPFQISFWAALFSIALFVVLTGASASVVRAGIMGSLLLLAEREGRQYHMTNALVFAAALMIYHNPKILRFDTAFQLSFLATVGILYATPYVEKLVDRVQIIFSRMRGNYDLQRFSKLHGSELQSFSISLKRIFVETLSAQCFVLPWIVYLFGRVSIISPLSNIAVLVVVPYAMAVGFGAGVIASIWESAGRVAGIIAWLFLEYIIVVIQFFAKIPGASVEIGGIFLFLFLIGYGCMIFFVWRREHSTYT